MNCCGGSDHHSGQDSKKERELNADSPRGAEAPNSGSRRGGNKFFHILHWVVMFGLMGYFIVTSLKK